ncbi:MAG: hypothetical protein Q9160_008978 [Pyrenula sp. 1 TL-2023]
MTLHETQTYLQLLQETLTLARQAPLSPTNFRVGALVYSPVSKNIYATGFTGEQPGNTHAEENCLAKLAEKHGVNNAASALGKDHYFTLITSFEPCGKRLSGKKSCVERILETRKNDGGIQKVVFGAKEPGTFVQDSQACKMMTDAGLEWEFVSDMENDILSVAREGHVEGPEKDVTNIDDISPEERARQEAIPRNPKKRMMEVPPPP